MTSSSVWKLEDHHSYPTNCFPARGIARKLHEGAGSWVVAYAEEQQTKLQATLKPSQLILPIRSDDQEDANKVVKEKPLKSLNAAYLIRKHHVDNATDLCSVNVSDKGLNHAQEEEFKQFINVAYVNAAENSLPLRPFRSFTNLRELELPVNGIHDLQLNYHDFPNLQVLDLSYNCLTAKDVLALGVLQNLKVLTLTGNGLTSIHSDMARPEIIPTRAGGNDVIARFNKLEVLYLDHNHLSDLSTFASLAALPQLRELILDENGIEVIPHLKVVGDRVISETQSSMGHHHLSVASSGKKSRMSLKASSEKAEDSQTEDNINLKSPTPGLSHGYPADEITEQDRSVEFIGSLSTPNPPFQHLRLLSVTNNRIKDEECVLAVAAWPRLKHIVLHNNPIVNTTKGDPPLLAYYLKERLGINIHRFEKKTSVPKPPLRIPVEKDRKVDSYVPKIPKQPVDVLIRSLMPPTTSQPPICSPTDNVEDKKENTAPEKETSAVQPEEKVFLTQVEEQHEEEKTLKKTTRHERKKTRSPVKKLPPGGEKYQGYEVILDGKEELCNQEDVGIQGNVRVLHQMLAHPNLLGSTDVTLDRVLPVYQPQVSRHEEAMSLAQRKKTIMFPSKQQVLESELRKLRDRKVIEADLPLNEALSADSELANEAEILLEAVDKKYRVVRDESLKASEGIKSAFEESRKLMADLAK